MKPTPFIEVFGLCGAGKTVLLQRLLPVVQKIGGATAPTPEWPVEPTTYAVRRASLAVVLRFAATSPLKFSTFMTRSENRWLVKKIGYRVAGLRMRGIGRPVFLVDSGILQPFVSFVIEERDSVSNVPVRTILSSLAPPRLALYVKTTPCVALGRYLRREKEAGRSRDEEKLGRKFAAGQKVCDQLERCYRQSELTIITVDSTDLVSDQEIRQIAELIIEHSQFLKTED